MHSRRNSEGNKIGAVHKTSLALYRGKVHYHLGSCQSTLSLAVGIEEHISCVF